MAKKFVYAILGIMLVAGPLLRAQTSPQAVAQDVEDEMVRLTNQARAKEGLPELKPNDGLRQAAREHSRLLAEHRELQHQFAGEPDLSARVAAQGVRFNSVAENVSLTSEQPPAESSHRGLMNSPPHRANILNKDYNSIGIGVVRSGDTYYITEDFARSFAAVSPAEAEDAVLRAVNDARRKQHYQAVRLVRLDRLNAVACQSQTTVQSLLAAFPSAQGAVVFTTWNAAELPAPMLEMANVEHVETLSLKACTQAEARGGSGGFKIAALFF